MIFNLPRPSFGPTSWDFVPASGETPPEWDAEGADWMMAVPVSGTLTLSVGIPRADLCLVAGGKPGNSGADTAFSAGGAGGEVLALTGISLPAGVYHITVGGSGQDTVIAAPDGRSWTARSGSGATEEAAGSLAWGDANTLLRSGWLYGPAGGRGFVLDYRYIRSEAHPGGSVGAASDDENAGHGGTEAHPAGYPGIAGTGQAGGGGARIWNGSSYNNSPGGAGGSGAVLIRKHKEEVSA